MLFLSPLLLWYTFNTIVILNVKVLLVMIHSLVLIIITLVNLLITMAVSFALVYLLAKDLNVAAFDPAIM